MSSLNKVQIIGRLGSDPETRTMQNGSVLCNLSVATSESWKDKATGEKKEKTEWHRVVIFNNHLADIAGKHLSKGDSVYIEGQLQTRKWTDNNGADRYSTEIVLQNYKGDLKILNSSGSGSGGSQVYGDSQFKSAIADRDAPQKPALPAGVGASDFDDEIPF